ncbi:hypothetical protein BgiMline_027731, partial [Biomphalaria glabrata]
SISLRPRRVKPSLASQALTVEQLNVVLVRLCLGAGDRLEDIVCHEAQTEV